MVPPVAAPASSLSTGRGAAREEAICGAVMELLAESSFDAVTVDAVAARARASKATIYRRWPNKDALVLDVLKREFLAGVQDPVDTGSLRGDLLANFTRDLGEQSLCSQKSAALRSLATATANSPATIGPVMEALHAAQLTLWQTLLDRAHQRGELARQVDATLPCEVALAMFCNRTSLRHADLDPVFLAGVVDDVILPIVRHQASPPES